MQINKIFISGGWGYRNLGDDALLKATIDLVNYNLRDTSEIIVSSYNPSDSKRIISGSIKVVPSVDRKIFGKYFFRKFLNFNQKEKLFFRKIKNKFLDYFIAAISILHLITIFFIPSFYLRIVKKMKNEIYQDFENVDLFIMSGGGYFNSWRTSLVSRFIEIEIAKLQGAKILLIGQTIGPFNNYIYKKIAKYCLQKCDIIAVRDIASLQELKSLDINVENDIIPDIALYTHYSFPKKKRITIVPFYEKIREKGNQICNVLKKIQEGTNLEIAIAISQQWEDAKKNACYLFQLLQLKNCNVQLFIPSDVDELQKILGESNVVISQNLHGLILAYRAGSAIISLNDKRKFQTFLKITDKVDHLIAMIDLEEDILMSNVTKCIHENTNIDIDIRQCLANTIKLKFKQYIFIFLEC
jgi:polysaccharide pyruvyl transferase WcaK-like protein